MGVEEEFDEVDATTGCFFPGAAVVVDGACFAFVVVAGVAGEAGGFLSSAAVALDAWRDIAGDETVLLLLEFAGAAEVEAGFFCFF